MLSSSSVSAASVGASRDDVNIAAALAAGALRRSWNERPAYFQDDRCWTHGDVHSLAARLSTVLLNRGVQPGSRVLVALPDRIELIVLFLAVGRLGATSFLVNPYLTEADHGELAERIRPRLVVSEEQLREHFAEFAWACCDGLLTTAQHTEEASCIAVGSETPLYVQYTSGTTGEPKGAVHRHTDIAAYHRAVGEDMLRLGPADVSLSISKMFFAYGFGNTLVYPLCSGSSAVLIPQRSRPQVVEEMVERHAVTVLHGVPSAYANLVAETSAEAYRTVRVGVSAGESLSIPLGERAAWLLGAVVLNELGSTEVGGAFCANTLASNEPGTVGRPLQGYRLRIRDEGGADLADGVEGRLWVHGPTLLTEYLDRPEETARVFDDGWLSTNDTAIRRPDGWFVHTGRADDMEVVGGINISPHEVESVLMEHSGVREVAVVAIHDERGASKLRAFVVPAPSAAPERLEDELITLARQRLAPFKVPRSVHFVGALPRTFTGKLKRYRVRQGAW
ncbi:MAG: class I adenylate-forming enzyme family protein [Pseudonocardiaceae bacterium]